MQRIIAVLVLVFAGLSLMVSARAFDFARHTNSGQITVITTGQAALQVDVGPNNPGGVVKTSGGRLVLDLNTYGLDTDSTTKLSNIIRVTNTTGAQKTVTVSIIGTSPGTFSLTGTVPGNAEKASPWTLPVNQYVDLTLQWTTGSTDSGSMTIVIGEQ